MLSGVSGLHDPPATSPRYFFCWGILSWPVPFNWMLGNLETEVHPERLLNTVNKRHPGITGFGMNDSSCFFGAENDDVWRHLVINQTLIFFGSGWLIGFRIFRHWAWSWGWGSPFVTLHSFSLLFWFSDAISLAGHALSLQCLLSDVSYGSLSCNFSRVQWVVLVRLGGPPFSARIPCVMPHWGWS